MDRSKHDKHEEGAQSFGNCTTLAHPAVEAFPGLFSNGGSNTEEASPRMGIDHKHESRFVPVPWSEALQRSAQKRLDTIHAKVEQRMLYTALPRHEKRPRVRNPVMPRSTKVQREITSWSPQLKKPRISRQHDVLRDIGNTRDLDRTSQLRKSARCSSSQGPQPW